MSTARRVGIAVGALVVGTVVGLLLGFRGPALGPATAGDPALAADVRATFATDRGLVALSAARVRAGETTFAGLGEIDGSPPGPGTPFELGSITKTFTAALLADAVRRGEVALDDPVSVQLTELAGTDAGASTYRQLATHSAGLPAFPSSSVPLVLLHVVGNDNPYDGSVDDLLAATRGTTVEGRGTYRYSNLGVALLGHALARAAGAPGWAELLQERVLDPLGMSETVIATDVEDVPGGAAPPHLANGWPAPFWNGVAFAPAGSSTVTTAADLATWARALLDGSAPGSSALDPVADIPGGQIGLAWHVRDVDGRTLTWHNGGTGGTRTVLALDRERGQAVLVLQSSARDVDTAGFALAAADPARPPAAVDHAAVGWAGLIGWNVVGLLMIGTAVRRWHAAGRWAALDGTLAAAAGLLLLLAHGPWLLVPSALWGGLLLGVGTFGVLAARTPGPARAPQPVRRGSAVLSLVGTVLVLALAVWSL